MRLARILGTLATAGLLMGAGEGGEAAKKGPPFADGPDPKPEVKEKPATRVWNVKSQATVASFAFVPGIPDPDQVTEVTVLVGEVPKVPHPRYGNRLPVDGARLVVEVTNPAGQLVARLRAHPLPLTSSKYGFHFTPTQSGVYGLALRGKTADGRDLAADAKLPVATWPLPAELEGSGDAEAASGGIRSVIRTPAKN
jgi:hypothetical protein